MAKHVTAGEKFRFGAQTYNELNGLIEKDRLSGLSMQAKGARGNNDFVLVKNISGTDIGRFGILGIAGIVFDPQTALPAFVSRTVFTGEMPTESHQTGRFLICAEPIKNGAIGRAWADGIVTTRLFVQDASHNYATVKPDDTTQLISADQGLCYILYKEAGTGQKWAVLRYGSTGNSLRWAFCSEDAGFGNTLDCFLDTDGTGTLVTVYFKLLNCSNIEDGHFTLTDGVPIPVMKRGGNWWCIIPIEGTQVVA
ncbi:MAG: hypothetical protein OEV87_01225 [Phycisphaerae bacterium]|nr:hypothetical protein [Phycisphaerae bacterium]HRS71426.1 hypothetical protein [Anaerohalosphaeraceae bacterium]